MVPRLATAGSSFQGAFLYYCHDKRARTRSRVAWTETVNMMTDCIDKAWKVMAYTARVATQLKRAAGKKRAADKVEKPVISYSLSWHPEQTPDKKTMLEAARSSIKHLKLQEHEAFIIAHTDEPQPHVHVVVNRIHPLTGIAANLYYPKRKLQDWARDFQREEGTDYCPKREENYQKRKQGMKTRYGDPKIIEAWQQSDSGQSFKEALKIQGYDLARGTKRLVVVDPYGKTLNPVRMLPDVKAAEFNARLKDLDPQDLPSPEQVIYERAQEPKIDAAPEPAQPEMPAPAAPKNEPNPAQKSDDQKLEDRIQAYEERVFAALTKQGERHHEEWEKAQVRKQQRIDRMRSQLTERYRLEDRQDKIDGLQAKLDAPRLMPKFARKLFGMDRKTEEKLGTLRATQDKAKKRFDQAMRTFEKQEAEAIQNLESRHAEEQRTLSQNFEKWRPKDQSRTPDTKSQNRSPKISIEWHTDGPGLRR